MRISDWSSDVCSSDLLRGLERCREAGDRPQGQDAVPAAAPRAHRSGSRTGAEGPAAADRPRPGARAADGRRRAILSRRALPRSEEHTSEHQSLMRISYAVSCLKIKTFTVLHITPTSAT